MKGGHKNDNKSLYKMAINTLRWGYIESKPADARPGGMSMADRN